MPPALIPPGTSKPYGLILIALFICTCRTKPSFFCLADPPICARVTTAEIEGTAPVSSSTLSNSLDQEVLRYRANSFAASTSRTYSAQHSAFLKFCVEMKISPVPLLQENLGRYIAFLSRRLCFNSVKQYLNIVRLMHLEAGFQNPLEKNWYVDSILKGVRRIKGDASVQKLPITIDILRQLFITLNLECAFDRTFWAACLVGFFSFFRKSNLLVPSHVLFDPDRNLCANDLTFTLDSAILTVRWSKVIQFKERVLHIPLPKINNSPFCPSTALLRLTLENPACPQPTSLFRYTWMGASNVPLTHDQFTKKLRSSLDMMGLDASKFSGHSLRRGGAMHDFNVGCPLTSLRYRGTGEAMHVTAT